MQSYELPADEHSRVPDDAINVRRTKNIYGEPVVRFHSNDGPVTEEPDTDSCGCNTDESDESLLPDRRTPWGSDR